MTKTLLRYPGSKAKAAPQIRSLFPGFHLSLCSPFFGGGALELACEDDGMRVRGYDQFPPLVNFWQQALDDPEGLYDAVMQYYPMDKDSYNLTRTRFWSIGNDRDRAAAYWALNRSSFAGKTFSGYAAHHPELPEKQHDNFRNAAKRIASFKAEGLTVELADFRWTLEVNQGMLTYLDPPYYGVGKTYYSFGKSESFHHEALAKVLRDRELWVLSYNDCPEVRELYKGFQIIEPRWTYSMHQKHRKFSELLIVSKDLETE